MKTLFSQAVSDTRTHAENARLWMAENPAVMRKFEALALERASRGERFGVKQLAEYIRWHEWFGHAKDNVAYKGFFKVHNNHVAYIARELIRRHPRLKEFIELRKAKETPCKSHTQRA